MLKENSLILRKSDKELGAIETYGLNKVANWTKNEIEELQQKSKLPICIELNNGDYIVATRRVEKVSSLCYTVEELEFTNKRNAIFYCSLLHINRPEIAAELHKLDTIVSKHDNDKTMFRFRLDAAHTANDSFKIDLYSSRFEDAKTNLKKAKHKLDAIIAEAKLLITRAK